jgi:hypothetical protein
MTVSNSGFGNQEAEGCSSGMLGSVS